jgi:adenylate cyclase
MQRGHLLSKDERRLAAIMFTDMVGYTALTQRNEHLALGILDKHNELIRPVLSRFNGTEVKTIGDSFLIEFSSALEAAECSVEVQRAFHEFNEDAKEKIFVRVGIHVGDVVHRGNDIFGDAVNITSRIESLAQGGEVCISEQVYAQIRNKLPFRMTKLETQQLKNVSFPVVVYKLDLPWEEAAKTVAEMRLDLNRIAVLPFANISPDPNDEYFADGLTEELISRLSLVKGLKVIARTSIMKYKGKEKGISEIAKELSAGVLVEGSVRKAGNKIRVTVQVINANNEEHLWSSSYDNNLDDIFAVQAEIASKVSLSLPQTLPHAKSNPRNSADTNNVTAYTYYLKGKQLLNERTDASIRKALELFTDATKLDPSFSRAYAAIGTCYADLGVRSYISKDEVISEMRSNAMKALQIDENLAEGHSLLARTAWGEDDFATAEREARRAIDLNPNLSEAYRELSMLKIALGYQLSALRLMESAHLLDPLSSETIRLYGLALFCVGRDTEALDLWNRNLEVAPFDVHYGLAVYYLNKKEFRKVEEEVKALEVLLPNDFTTLCMRGYLSALKGDKNESESIIEKLQQSFKGGATLERNIGYIRYFLGDMDAFFDAMFRGAETRVLDPMTLRYFPLLEKARLDPRYGELMRRVGLDPEVKEPFT